MSFVNPFEKEGIWLKGNLHCHTTNSDGVLSPQEKVDYYVEQGYDFLAITDHDTYTETDKLDSGDMVLLDGIEFTAKDLQRTDGYHVGFHIGGVNIRNPLPFCLGPQETIDFIKEQGGFAVINHPYWCGQTVMELLELKNYDAIEAFNSVCEHGWGRGSSTQIWDGLLANGRAVPGLGTDDAHEKEYSFHGFIMLKARSKDTASIMEALNEGAFYGSTGPVIKDFRKEPGCNTFTIECDQALQINFQTNRSFGKSFWAKDGEDLTSAKLERKHPPNPEQTVRYCRAEIICGLNQYAWTNPIELGGETIELKEC